MSEMSHDTVESTGNISTRLREGAQTGRWNADNADYACGVSIAEAEHAADELDRLRAENEQKDAEIADLRLRLDRWNHGDNSIGAKYSAKQAAAEIESLRQRLAVVDDLATLVRRLVHALRKPFPDISLQTQAMDYLRRSGLNGSPLRDRSNDAEIGE